MNSAAVNARLGFSVPTAAEEGKMFLFCSLSWLSPALYLLHRMQRVMADAGLDGLDDDGMDEGAAAPGGSDASGGYAPFDGRVNLALPTPASGSGTFRPPTAEGVDNPSGVAFHPLTDPALHQHYAGLANQHDPDPPAGALGTFQRLPPDSIADRWRYTPPNIPGPPATDNNGNPCPAWLISRPGKQNGSGAASAQSSWGLTRLPAEGLYKAITPPAPRVSQTGSWSEPYFAADAGQSGTAAQGAQAIRDAFSSGKGGVYGVDPKTMGMEGGIDIGQQIQDSIDGGGYMKGVLDRATQSGKPEPFDSYKWGSTGLRGFDHHPFTPDGSTVGRWGGVTQGSLSATPDGKWSVTGNVWPEKVNPYNFDRDAGGNFFNRTAGNAMIAAGQAAQNILGGGSGAPVWLNFNRVYNFGATGHPARNGNPNGGR